MTSDARAIYVTALKNTHALELQALQIMERQVERLENYPEMEVALRRHIEETHGQRDRLEEALSSLSETPSVLKEGFLGFVGNMMAIAHVPAQDEILKNTFANQAFENFEIAAYTSLIAMAEASGHQRFVPALEETLREEQKTAQLIRDQIVPITQKYLMREAQGLKADR